MRKSASSPDQIPMFVPDSDWSAPTQLPDLRGKVKDIALDTETKDFSLSAGRGGGWPYGTAKLCGVSAAWSGGSFYAPIMHPDSICLDKQVVADWIKDHDRAGVRFIFHNAPYDCGMLWSDAGINPVKLIDDTTCMAAMVDESRKGFTLDEVCEWLQIEGKDETLLNDAGASYGFAGNIKANLWRLPAKYVGPYAENDAIATLRVAQKLRPIIEEEGTGEGYQVEMDLIPMVLEMRRRGIRVDVLKAEQTRDLLLARRDQELRELSDKLKHTVGIKEVHSARHVETWFLAEGLQFPRTLKSNQGQFLSDWLEHHPHWLPNKITRIRQLERAQSVFLQNYIIDFSHNGRLHANVNQFKSENGGTKSHRVSYSNPPLQQIYGRESNEIKKELVPLIRGVFLPEEGEIWAACDFSQQEYRLIVHYSELMNLPKAKAAGDRYRNDPNTDFHDYVAEITRLERSRAKDTNFAKSYGSGIPKFAMMTHMDESEAKRVMNQYDEELPFVREAAKACRAVADRRGFIRLIDNSRFHFNSWEPSYRDRQAEKIYGGEDGVTPCSLQEAQRRVEDTLHPWKGRLVRAYVHKALNHLIQSSAARQTKKAMKLCWEEGYVPLLQMHDELDFSITQEKQGVRISEIMRDAIKLVVPMKVDVEYGMSWGTARKIKNQLKEVVYGATWAEAQRLLAQGKWW